MYQGCHDTGKTDTGDLPQKYLKICLYTGNLPPAQGKFRGEKKDDLVILSKKSSFAAS